MTNLIWGFRSGQPRVEESGPISGPVLRLFSVCFFNVMPRISFSVFNYLLPSVDKMKRAGEPTRSPWRRQPGATLPGTPPPPVPSSSCVHTQLEVLILIPRQLWLILAGQKRRRWFCWLHPIEHETHIFSSPPTDACPITCTNVITLLTKPLRLFETS